jgi:hypothetical protein
VELGAERVVDKVLLQINGERVRMKQMDGANALQNLLLLILGAVLEDNVVVPP